MNADEPAPRAQHAPGTTFHHLGRTADGRQVFVPVPPGADAAPILATARSGHEGMPEGAAERAVEFAPAGRVVRLEDIKPKFEGRMADSMIKQGVADARDWPQAAPPFKLEPVRGKSPARNAPCPCGSGRKHKRCCRRI